MSGIERVSSRRTSVGRAPLAQIVLDDRYAFLSGVLAGDLPEAAGLMGDTAAETRAVLMAVRDMLGELGLDMGDVVRVDVHLTDLDDFEAMNSAFREFFPQHALPARTTTEVARLLANSRVEITIIARRR